MKRCKTSRHPTGKKTQNPTDSPSLISCGTKEKRLLGYILKLNGERFNVRSYSRLEKASRSTVYEMLNRLVDKGLLHSPNFGNHIITDKGKAIFDVLDDVQTSRRGCREIGNLSTHYQRYELMYETRPRINEILLSRLNPDTLKINELSNQKQYYAGFSDGTLIFTTHKIMLRVHDIITNNVDDSIFKSLNIVIGYVQRLEALGFKITGTRLQTAHYARVKSVFSEVLSEIDSHYYIDLGSGRKFWIDNSNGNREDETNYLELRERLDDFISDLPTTRAKLSDIDKLTSAVRDLYLIVLEAKYD